MKLITFIESFFDGDGEFYEQPIKTINIEHMISFDYEIEHKENEHELSLIFRMVKGKDIKVKTFLTNYNYKDAKHEEEGSGAYNACIALVEEIIEMFKTQKEVQEFYFR